MATLVIAGSSESLNSPASRLLMIDAVCRQTGRVTGDPGDLPLTVITSSEHDPKFPDGSRFQRGRRRVHPGWMRLQEELAALSANSVRVTAANSGLHLQRDDPELVVNSIADLAHRARQA